MLNMVENTNIPAIFVFDGDHSVGAIVKNPRHWYLNGKGKWSVGMWSADGPYVNLRLSETRAQAMQAFVVAYERHLTHEQWWNEIYQDYEQACSEEKQTMSRHDVAISDEVLKVLTWSTVEGNKLYLPNYQLDRQLYISVNKILKILGGTWNRKAKAHVFDHDPSGDLAAAIESGKVEDWKKKYQFYETPEDLAERMVELAELEEGQAILEPSAGRGAIAEVIRDKMPPCCKLDVVEIYEQHTQLLAEREFSLASTDFLEMRYIEYDRIIMNPPFTGLQDVDHILHAYECLAPGGRIVGIMGESAFFVDYKKAVKFREWFDEVGGQSEQLPQDTFKESGTGGWSRLVVIDKKV